MDDALFDAQVLYGFSMHGFYRSFTGLLQWGAQGFYRASTVGAQGFYRTSTGFRQGFDRFSTGFRQVFDRFSTGFRQVFYSVFAEIYALLSAYF
jgi:hypothetical protein